MIWNGTDPLHPDHEVAYRGWPTKRVRIHRINKSLQYPVAIKQPNGLLLDYGLDGKYYDDGFDSVFDLIPLQQEQPK